MPTKGSIDLWADDNIADQALDTIGLQFKGIRSHTAPAAAPMDAVGATFIVDGDAFSGRMAVESAPESDSRAVVDSEGTSGKVDETAIGEARKGAGLEGDDVSTAESPVEGADTAAAGAAVAAAEEVGL